MIAKKIEYNGMLLERKYSIRFRTSPISAESILMEESSVTQKIKLFDSESDALSYIREKLLTGLFTIQEHVLKTVIGQVDPEPKDRFF